MASKRNIRKKMCVGKQRYLTIEAAQLAVYKATKRYKQPFTPYKCKFGEHYHIGHNWHNEKGTY